MENLVVCCPVCNTQLQVTSEQVGMETQCPVCGSSFVIPAAEGNAEAEQIVPRRPPPPPSTTGLRLKQLPPLQTSVPAIYSNALVPRPSEQESSQTEETSSESSSVGKVLSFLIICAIGALLYWGYTYYNGMAIANQVKTKELPTLFQSSNFIYHGGTVQTVELHKETSKHYTGMVTFTLNGKQRVRPIEIFINSTTERYVFGLGFDYAYNDDYLKEDAEIFFYELVKKAFPKENTGNFKITNVAVQEPGVVRVGFRTGTRNTGRFLLIKVTSQKPKDSNDAGSIYFEVIDGR